MPLKVDYPHCGQCEEWIKDAEKRIAGTKELYLENIRASCPKGYGEVGFYERPSCNHNRSAVNKSFI